MLQYLMKYQSLKLLAWVYLELITLSYCVLHTCYAPILQMKTSIFLYSSIVILSNSVLLYWQRRNCLTDTARSNVRSLARLSGLWNTKLITFTHSDLQLKTERALQLDCTLSIPSWTGTDHISWSADSYESVMSLMTLSGGFYAPLSHSQDFTSK